MKNTQCYGCFLELICKYLGVVKKLIKELTAIVALTTLRDSNEAENEDPEPQNKKGKNS